MVDATDTSGDFVIEDLWIGIDHRQYGEHLFLQCLSLEHLFFLLDCHHQWDSPARMNASRTSL